MNYSENANRNDGSSDTHSNPLLIPKWLEDNVVRQVTQAPLRMKGTFQFDADQNTVFKNVSEPANMAKWFPFLRSGELNHDASCSVGDWGEGSRRTCYTNGLGTLHESIHHWDAPFAYAYEVKSMMMPIENHLALMIVTPMEAGKSQLEWRQYFDLTGIAMKLVY